MEQNSENLNWSVSDRDDTEDAREIHEALKAHAEIDVGPPKREPLVITVRDRKTRELIGGLRGYSHWNWVYVSHVWVAEAHRSSGVGKAVLEKLSVEAKKRNARGIYLDTFDERSRAFYEREGFQSFGKIDEFFPGRARYFMLRRF